MPLVEGGGGGGSGGGRGLEYHRDTNIRKKSEFKHCRQMLLLIKEQSYHSKYTLSCGQLLMNSKIDLFSVRNG